VHVRRVGSPGHEVALLFRDWLRTHPQEVGAYADLKRELAATRSTTTDYTAAKEPWLAPALGRARAWAGETQWTA
jgi:dephospho-CoA kinase